MRGCGRVWEDVRGCERVWEGVSGCGRVGEPYLPPSEVSGGGLGAPYLMAFVVTGSKPQILFRLGQYECK